MSGAAPQGKGDRIVSVYDGQRQIGIVIERADKTCIAKDANGKKLGTYSNARIAADAISDVDRLFRRADGST
jgi:hypothetical protein